MIVKELAGIVFGMIIISTKEKRCIRADHEIMEMPKIATAIHRNGI